jgi:hypothetical protein
MRRLLAFATLLGGLLWLRRRETERRDRVTLHYDDGSAVTLEQDAPAAARLAELARAAL